MKANFQATICVAFISASLALAACTPRAGEAADSHAGHGAAAADDVKGEFADAFRAANARMHKAMDIKLTGDPDIDFVRSMIPHHQGAVEMAELQLKYGKDLQIRQLAEDVIAAQNREIEAMRAWLSARGAE
jgi:uncharacterized protein (DUF305 family)